MAEDFIQFYGRTIAISTALAEANAFRDSAYIVKAEKLYEAVLAVDSTNAAAREGLSSIQRMSDVIGFKTIERWPTKMKLTQENALDDFFVGSLKPSEPIIDSTKNITAFGSCFAANVSKHLKALGYRVNAHDWRHASSDFIRINELMVHTPALVQQFEWALLDKPMPRIFEGEKDLGVQSYFDQKQVADMVKQTDIFIVTFGLSEAWFDTETGNYLWKLALKKSLDPSRFVHKRISAAENTKNVQRIYELIRSSRPNADIVLTLSPIPLMGTFQGRLLVQHSNDTALHYFPSYEIINHYCGQSGFEADNRHVTEAAITTVMKCFEKHYCVNEA